MIVPYPIPNVKRNPFQFHLKLMSISISKFSHHGGILSHS